jgi:hypothetical protein
VRRSTRGADAGRRRERTHPGAARAARTAARQQVTCRWSRPHPSGTVGAEARRARRTWQRGSHLRAGSSSEESGGRDPRRKAVGPRPAAGARGSSSETVGSPSGRSKVARLPVAETLPSKQGRSERTDGTQAALSRRSRRSERVTGSEGEGHVQALGPADFGRTEAERTTWQGAARSAGGGKSPASWQRSERNGV